MKAEQNIIGIMNWYACKSCKRTDCIKPIGNFTITANEVICKNHSIYIFAVVGIINKIKVCNNCKNFDNHFKTCGFETIYECNLVEYAINNENVKCQSFEVKNEP